MGNNETILVVEDEAAVRRLIAKLLDMQGFHVLEARHGEEALALSDAYKGRIHLLVTDIMMPVMNGHELATRLSALRPGMGVLFISGYPGNHIPESLVSDPCVDYMAKPFKFETLTQKIRELLLRGLAKEG